MSRNIDHRDCLSRIVAANHISEFVCLSEIRVNILIFIYKYIGANGPHAAGVWNKPRFWRSVFKI